MVNYKNTSTLQASGLWLVQARRVASYLLTWWWPKWLKFWLHDSLGSSSNPAEISLCSQGLTDATIVGTLQTLDNVQGPCTVRLTGNQFTPACLAAVIQWMEGHPSVAINLGSNNIPCVRFLEVVKAAGHPDWTEQGRISLAGSREHAEVERLAAKLVNQSSRTSKLDNIVLRMHDAVARTEQAVQESTADARATFREMLDLWGAQDELVKEEVNDAVHDELSELKFSSFDRANPDFRKILRADGKLLVEWDGMLACDRGDLKVLVLVKTFLKSDMVEGRESLPNIKRAISHTAAYLQAVADGRQPQSDQSPAYLRQCSYFRVGFPNRHLVAAVGLKGWTPKMRELAVMHGIVCVDIGDWLYSIAGLREAISSFAMTLAC